ncbi:MAG: DUF6443 domain-containing protein [Janthinobacterium lividum]
MDSQRKSTGLFIKMSLSLLLLLGIHFQAVAQNYNVSGPATVIPNATITYTYAGYNWQIYDSWFVYGGTVQSMDSHNIIIKWDAPGQGYISYDTYDASGTFANDGILNVTIACSGNGQGLVVSKDQEISLGSSATITASGGYDYSWSVNGNTFSTDDQISVSPTSTTTYLVTAMVCAGTQPVPASKTVTIYVAEENSNHVITHTPTQAGYHTWQEVYGHSQTADHVQTSTQYLDGLGRPLQTVAYQASSSKKDVIVPITYDALGRPATTYLPYTDGTNGLFKTNALTQQATFYQVTGDNVANDAAPWAVTEYEPSPLGRVLRQGAPGTTWQPDVNAPTAWTSADHTTKFLYRTNTDREVRIWECGTEARAVSSPGYYSAGQLTVTESKDENGHLTVEYKDKNGQMLVKKVQEDSPVTSTMETNFLVTQYVYDVFNRLRLVIQPEGTRSLPQPSGAGTLRREFWGGKGKGKEVTGKDVWQIPLGKVPDVLTKLTSFEAPVDSTEYYGQRVRGYVTAPTTGLYQFYISSDDKSQLWLSTSEAPDQKRLIAYEDVWTPSRTWNWHATQASAPIYLEVGKRYYIEALQKEDDGGDNLAVGWVLPNGSFEGPLPSTYLSTDAINLPASFITTWCFRYDYDSWGRVVEKQVPGGGPIEMVYNRRDQIVLQRGHAPLSPGTWLATKYDALNRVVLSGLVTLVDATSTPRSRTEAQQLADAWTQVDYERPTTATTLGYTFTEAFPALASEGDAMTVAYYDNYDFPRPTNTGFVAETGMGPTASSKLTIGLSTGHKERVLDGSSPAGGQWLTTVTYYDDEQRAVQTRRELYPQGWERVTQELDFLGWVRKSLTSHHAHDTNASVPEHTIAQELDYDHAGRLVDMRQQVDSQPMLLLAHQEYNELGQAVDKKLHSTDYTLPSASRHFLQSVDYRYNIRGWLTNINDRNLSNGVQNYPGVDPNTDNTNTTNTGNEGEDLFGMELVYDTNQNPLQALQVPQYNGNISEALWRTNNPTQTGKIPRGYSYKYDAANRLISADYRTYEGGQWAINSTDYSVSNIHYDANGNLRSMDRQGLTSVPGATIPTWSTIDLLRYSYEGNRLAGVDDNATSASTHDFKDLTGAYTPSNTPNQGEYRYDAIGNLIADDNKSILQVQYNVLNKPSALSLRAARGLSSSSITYIYSTTGEKLQKITKEAKSKKGITYTYDTHYTNYTGSFVYEDQVLKYAPTAEGRMLYTTNPPNGSPLHWKYEYHLKDHLGNLRFAFQADKDGNQETQFTSMEPATAVQEEGTFAHVTDTRLADPEHARTGTYVARLNARDGHRAGPTITVAVAAGDSVRAEVFGRYERETSAGNLVQRGALLVGAAIGATPGPTSPEQAPGTGTRTRRPFIGLSLGLIPQLLKVNRAKLPVAYLRYELFNQDSQLVAVRTQALQRTTTDQWQALQAGMRADSAGYARISLLNESDVPAYFDDLTVNKVAPAPYQENHYDPFGLNLVGIESATGYDSKFQFNSKEKQEDFGLSWIDYGARMYDAQIGRWHAADPLADLAVDSSPFTAFANNPIYYIDPTGLAPFDWFRDGNNNNAITYRDNIHSQEDLKAAGINGTYMGKDIQMLFSDGSSLHGDSKGNLSFTTPEAFVGSKGAEQYSSASMAIGVTLTGAAGTSQLDSPAPGPADIAAGGMIIGGVLGAGVLKLEDVYEASKDDEFVNIYKAPQPGMARRQLINGFQSSDFPYNPHNPLLADGNAYFAAPDSRHIAAEYARMYGAHSYRDTIIQVTMPRRIYDGSFKALERPHLGTPGTELAVPQSLFPVLNMFPRTVSQ